MLKRFFDFTLASLGIIFFFPVGSFFAFLIRREDGGAIFYKQERWGRGGRKFKVYKFRTMIENGSRVTRIGKLLRAVAMDELPQLINIWKGDMSFVGPRALAVEELSSSFSFFKERHQIRPGLTGLAQVYASRYASLGEKFRFDLEYIKNHTFWGDLKLLFLSLLITFRGKWESAEKKI